MNLGVESSIEIIAVSLWLSLKKHWVILLSLAWGAPHAQSLLFLIAKYVYACDDLWTGSAMCLQDVDVTRSKVTSFAKHLFLSMCMSGRCKNN